jgi:hypothetical protein
MSFIFKSAMGLGAVYFAMFSPALKSGEIAPTAALCASAAQARVNGDASLRGQWAAAGCALRLGAETQRLIASTATPPLPVRSAVGSLTDDDLREPWFGPGQLQRKAAKRG